MSGLTDLAPNRRARVGHYTGLHAIPHHRPCPLFGAAADRAAAGGDRDRRCLDGRDVRSRGAVGGARRPRARATAARQSWPAAARNRGLAWARGEWIAPLDADDAFAPDRIRSLVACAEQHGADVVSDNLLLCDVQGSSEGTPMIAPAAAPAPGAWWMSAADFVAGNIGSRYAPRVSYGFMKPVMRRSFLERHGLRYDVRNRFGEDFLLSLDCLLHGARWWVTPEPMYCYTVQAGTLTDVQSAGDLMRIRIREDQLLCGHPVVAADPCLARALQRHKAVIEHFFYYRAFTDAVKARSVGPALQFLLESPSSFRHIMTESAMQAPRVAIKALRGGFGNTHPAAPPGGTHREPVHGAAWQGETDCGRSESHRAGGGINALVRF